MSDDCIFCMICEGKLPSSKVYESDTLYAFLDLNPVHKGHTLVIPKKHCENILDCDPAIGQDVPGDRPVRETDISIDIREESLQDALALLHQLSGCNFLYDQSLVDSVPKITLNMRDASLSEILDRIASITNLQYSRVDNTITFAVGGTET